MKIEPKDGQNESAGFNNQNTTRTKINIADPIGIAMFFDGFSKFLGFPGNNRIPRQRALLVGKKFVSSSGKWPQPFNTPTDANAVVQKMNKNSQKEKKRPNFAKNQKNDKSKRNVN